MELTEYDPMRHHSIAYPMEVGAPKFELIPVEKQKDLMVNAARMHAEQEYNRIMELVKVLQKQAEDVKLRLDITDQVHKAEYKFQVYHGQCYWLARDTDANKPILFKVTEPRSIPYRTHSAWPKGRCTRTPHQ